MDRHSNTCHYGAVSTSKNFSHLRSPSLVVLIMCRKGLNVKPAHFHVFEDPEFGAPFDGTSCVARGVPYAL